MVQHKHSHCLVDLCQFSVLRLLIFLLLLLVLFLHCHQLLLLFLQALCGVGRRGKENGRLWCRPYFPWERQLVEVVPSYPGTSLHGKRKSLGTRQLKWFRSGLTHALVVAFLLVSDVSARVRAFLRLCVHKLHVIGAAYDNNRDMWVYLFS